MVATDGQSRTGIGYPKSFCICNIWKKRNERPNVGGVSIRSRNERRSVSKGMRGL